MDLFDNFFLLKGLLVYPDELQFEENGKLYQKFYDAAKHDYDYWPAKCTGTFEFLGNLIIQTNKTKQKLIRLYSLDCWIQIVQFDEQNKCLTKCTSIVQFNEFVCLFWLICCRFVWFMRIS